MGRTVDPDAAQRSMQDLSSPTIATRRGLYASLWHFAAGARLTLLAAIALLVASQLLRLSVAWFAGRAIDVLQTGGADAVLHAGVWVAVLLGVTAVTWALHGPGRVLERAVGVRVRRSITEALFDKLAGAPLAWHDRHAASDLQQRMGQASGALDDFAQNQYVVMQGLVTFVGTLVALIAFAPTTGLVAVAGYVVLVIVGMRFDRAMMDLADEENSASRRFSSDLLAFAGGIVTVASLRLEASTKRRLGARLDAIFEPLRRSIRLNEAKWCFVDVTTSVLTWGVVSLYVWQLRHAGSAILIGGVFVIYKYAEQAGGVVSGAASHFQSFARFRINFASADLIWDAPTRPACAVQLATDWKTLGLHRVRFAHAADGHDRASGIHDVDLVLRRGERIALVGPSGAGKSTLMRVVAGLYEPTHGHLTVDGVAHLNLRPLASITTFIPQDADAFEASVRDNIAPDGIDDAHDAAALAAALDVSALDRVLASMPDGDATMIAERGANLSGGQRQRLGLARGLHAARGSSLILLDEPTSALDPLTEAHVYRGLARRYPDATVIASVHRMSALAHFDRVVLMVDGTVVDSGSADDVAARQPLFAAMRAGDAAPQTLQAA